jgi:hypothetical protein
MSIQVIKNTDDLAKLRDSVLSRASTYKNTVYACGGAGCVSSHCDKVVEALKSAVENAGLAKDVRIVVTGASTLRLRPLHDRHLGRRRRSRGCFFTAI